MPQIDTFAKGAAVLALGFSLCTAPALADDQALYGVSDIGIGLSGAAPQVVVRNTAANHHIGNLKLAIQGATIAIGVEGHVECTGTQSENAFKRSGHYLSSAAYGIGRTSLLVGKTLPGSQSIDRTSASDAQSFQLPIAKLADPQIAVDPVAVVLAAANAAPNKVQWLRQDHTLTVKIPLRWEAGCASYTRNKVTKQTIQEAAEPSYMTRDVELKIKYEGDPQLFAVNAQIAQGDQPNGFQAGPQPFEITSAQFQPNMPHHVGACPATKQVRVFYQGKGQGELRIRLSAGNTPLQESGVIAYDSKNHTQNYVFELETPKGAALNNTIMHNLRVFVKTRSAGEQGWPDDYQLMDQAVWKTRCTPGLNPLLGAGGGTGNSPGYAGNQQGGAKVQPLPILPQAAPQKPARKAIEPARPVRQSTQ
jgi:hypothetical protein